MKANCHKCHHVFELTSERVLKSDECDKCGASIRCCLMCKFYDQSSYNECRESSAERIVDKEKANFCDFFQLGNGQGDREAERQSALDAAAALFKK